MPRPKSPRTNEFAFHVSARCNNKEFFFEPLRDTWNIFVEKLNATSANYGFQTHAFTLMGNHYHWLLSTPKSNLPDGMEFFQNKTSREVAKLQKRMNRIYGNRYKPTIIKTPDQFRNAYRYVLQNPMRAKIVNRVQDYRWCSFNEPLISLNLTTPFACELPKDVHEMTTWLNQLPKPELDDGVRRALQRAVYTVPKEIAKKIGMDH